MPEIELIYRRLGGKIRRHRLSASLTQGEFACKVGLTRTSIVNIEKGRQRVMLHHVLVMARVLRVPAAKLMGLQRAD